MGGRICFFGYGIQPKSGNVGSIGLKNTSSQVKTFYLYADTIDSTNKALFTKLNFSGKSSSIIVISKK